MFNLFCSAAARWTLIINQGERRWRTFCVLLAVCKDLLENHLSSIFSRKADKTQIVKEDIKSLSMGIFLILEHVDIVCQLRADVHVCLLTAGRPAHLNLCRGWQTGHCWSYFRVYSCLPFAPVQNKTGVKWTWWPFKAWIRWIFNPHFQAHINLMNQLEYYEEPVNKHEASSWLQCSRSSSGLLS